MKAFTFVTIESAFLLILGPIRKFNFSIHLNVYIINQSFNKNEPVHEISNNVVCATSKALDQPARTRSLIRAFARRLNIL